MLLYRPSDFRFSTSCAVKALAKPLRAVVSLLSEEPRPGAPWRRSRDIKRGDPLEVFQSSCGLRIVPIGVRSSEPLACLRDVFRPSDAACGQHSEERHRFFVLERRDAVRRSHSHDCRDEPVSTSCVQSCASSGQHAKRHVDARALFPLREGALVPLPGKSPTSLTRVLHGKVVRAPASPICDPVPAECLRGGSTCTCTRSKARSHSVSAFCRACESASEKEPKRPATLALLL